MIRGRLVGAACAAACALGAGMLSAQEARSYAWYAELVAVDQGAKTMTVKAQTREAVKQVRRKLRTRRQADADVGPRRGRSQHYHLHTQVGGNEGD